MDNPPEPPSADSHSAGLVLDMLLPEDREAILTRLDSLTEELTRIEVLAKTLEERNAKVESLQMELQEAHDVILTLEATCDRLYKQNERKDHIISHLNRQRLPHKHVHAIAMHSIFEALFPPKEFLYPSLASGPDSPWFRSMSMRKSLTLICKAWRIAALPFLYGEIVITRVGQIPALVRTLQSDVKGFGSLIHSISFRCYVPSNCRKATDDGVAYILSHCQNIASLGFTSTYGIFHPQSPLGLFGSLDCPPRHELIDIPPPNNPSISQIVLRINLSSLHYDTPFDFVPEPIPIIQLRTLLTIFHDQLTDVAFIPPAIEDPHLFSLPPLPKLQQLSLWHRGENIEETRILSEPTARFPALKRLTVRFYDWSGRKISPRLFYNHYLDFLRRHPWIHSVDLGACQQRYRLEDGVAYGETIRNIVLGCISLASLTVSGDYIDDATLDFLLSNEVSVFVDIYISMWYSAGVHRVIDNLQDFKRNFITPSHPHYLHPRARLLDQALSHLPNLTKIIPHDPSLSRNNPPRTYDAFGLRVIETSWCLWRQGDGWDLQWDGRPETMIDLEAEHGSQSDSDADSDSSYPPSCLDDTADSSDYESSSHDGTSGSSEVNSEDSEYVVAQISQDEVLEIFAGANV